MVMQIRPSRIETPARWQKALRRALENGVEILTASDDGERFATSASRLDLLHRVDPYRCTCEAGIAGDPICMHRAALRFVLGWLALPELDEAAATIDCPACQGCGWAYVEVDGGRAWPDQVECRRCDGSGRIGAWIRQVTPAAASVSLAAD
jgi:hypothetical protein